MAVPTGKELIHTLVELTGLPQDSVKTELESILERQDASPDTLTLEQLRVVLANYLTQFEHEPPSPLWMEIPEPPPGSFKH